MEGAANGLEGPSNKWLEEKCMKVIRDMNSYGISVLDNFLASTGRCIGDDILREVDFLRGNGCFREGRLVSNRLRGSSRVIRGDEIVWATGTEACCSNTGYLMRTIDSMVVKCNAMITVDGTLNKMSQYRITTRTKAMIACYPGNETHYVKHVDNPNHDGRCITTIYYLNKNWDKEKNGGLLRMFPVDNEMVADIAPIFDRLIFFWSDRRNPHEVHPAHTVRFAITVWYYDEEERHRAIVKEQKKHPQQQYQLDSCLQPFA